MPSATFVTLNVTPSRTPCRIRFLARKIGPSSSSIARFARDYLEDPHAGRYGRQGDRQHGIDVLARDRRPGGSGRLWVFQAKNYTEKSLRSADLEKLAELIESFPHRADIHTFVLVTTAHVSTSVRDKAIELRGRLALEFEVWDWDDFTELLIKHSGAGSWLSRKERLRLRQEYCDNVRSELREAGPLYPLPANLPGNYDVRLEDVLVPPILRLVPQPGHRTGGETASLADSPSDAADTPARYEGRLVDWLGPGPRGKPLVLVLAPIGSGKTVTLLAAAAELAEEAAKKEDAPLPLRVPAKDLAAVRLHELLRHNAPDARVRLWEDPPNSWILLVDALDEVEDQLQQRVLSEVAELHRDKHIAAIAITCRTSHQHPRLLPKATRIELPPWPESSSNEFFARWTRALAEQGHATPTQRPLLADPSTYANPLCSTLLAMQAPEGGEKRPGRAWLFRRLVDGIFRQWTRRRGADSWKKLREAFEPLALTYLAKGGNPIPQPLLESALAPILGDDDVAWAIEAGERELGLIQRAAKGTWELSFRAVAEYLAAGALLRLDARAFLTLAGQPWAGEVARLALDRCWEVEPRRALELLALLVRPHDEDDKDMLLRRALVAAQAARDWVHESAPAAQVVAERLFHVVTDETSEWRRQRTNEEVRNFARDGGPVWDALWEMLKPTFHSSGTRASWFARYGNGDAAYWIDKLMEQDAAVRAVANERLVAWKDQEDVQDHLLWEVLDEGYDVEGYPWRRPALAAAVVLREVRHSDDVREFLRSHLQYGPHMCAEAAAVALLPGEAEAYRLLGVLKDAISRGLQEPSFYQAIAAHCEHSASVAWLEQHWPEALEPSFAPPDRLPAPPPGDPRQPPPSRHVVRDLFASIAPALRRREIRELFEATPFRRELIGAICSIADIAPTPAVELLEKGGDVFIHASHQLMLGQAALQHAELAEALMNRWRTGVDARMPSSFPGVALDPLAARGVPEAVRIYAEWLPSSPFMMPLSAWQPPSRGALAQGAVRSAARDAAQDAWDYAVHGKLQPDGEVRKLHLDTLALCLRALWPAWEDAPAIRSALIEKCADATGEWSKVALYAWMDGEFPDEVAERIVSRFNHFDQRPPSPFLFSHLSIWLQGAARARVLHRIEPALVRLVENDERSIVHQAASYLMLLQPENAGFWSERAALASPFFSYYAFGIDPEDEERLLSAAPEAWVRAGLKIVEKYGVSVAPPFLRLARRIWSRLSDRAVQDEVVATARKLSEHRFPWVQEGIALNSVRIGDLAEELLFLLGEPQSGASSPGR